MQSPRGDCISNRVVGYSIADRMKPSLAFNSLPNAAAAAATWLAVCFITTVGRKLDSTGRRNTLIF
jgi:hypothetical protein